MTATRETVQKAFRDGVSSELKAVCPYKTGVLAAAWRSGRSQGLAQRHEGIMDRARENGGADGV